MLIRKDFRRLFHVNIVKWNGDGRLENNLQKITSTWKGELPGREKHSPDYSGRGGGQNKQGRTRAGLAQLGDVPLSRGIRD